VFYLSNNQIEKLNLVIGDVLSNLPMPFALEPTLVILTWKMGQNTPKGA